MNARERENARRRYVNALLGVWEDADDYARTYGARWYSDARAACEALAAETGFTTAQAIGAVAALSPRVHWHENIDDARTLLEWAADQRDGTYRYDVPVWGLKLRAFLANVHKAVECLTVSDPLTVLNGPKQRAFYRNIAGDADQVTVDVWATRAATRGKRDTPGSEYAVFAAAYRRAAARVGVSPRDFQAAVWIAQREQVGHARRK